MITGLRLLLSLMMVASAVTLTNCAKEPALKISAGQDKNLFRKSDLLVGPKDASAFGGELAKLAEPAVKQDVKVVEFQLTESFLTVWAESKDSGKALYQYAVVGHFDLAREKDKDGQVNQYLAKSKEVHALWSEREFIEVDPADVKLIKPTQDDMTTLYEVALLKDGEFVVGKDAIPGVDERGLQDLATKHGLVAGDKIKIQLTKSEATFIRVSQNGISSTIAKMSVEYVDLVRAKNDKEELTNKFQRSSKERPWNKRQYVVLSPDNVAVATNDISLVSKESLAGCRPVNKIASPEIRDALQSKGLVLNDSTEVCVEISQTALSVCNGSCADERNLLVTYDIIEHVDVKTVAENERPLPAGRTNLWSDRAYIRFVAVNPQLTEYKVQTNALKRSAFDGEFIYVATVIASHSENGSFFEGQTLNIDSRLKLEFSEDALVGYKLNEKLNPAGTRSPVVRYSADLFDIGRVKNGYGDATNVVAENKDKTWQDRKSARVNFASNQVAGYFNNFLGISNLYSNEFIVSGSSLVGEVNTATPGLIYFDTEEILTPNAKAGNMGSGETRLESTTVTIRHAFLRVDQRNAQPKLYDQYDFRRFGYFLVDDYSLDKDQRPTDETLKHFARIFDISANKNIVFALSANFPKKFHDEAENVVASWNKAFKAATGRDNVVVLKDNSGEEFGDPRNNMIVYIDQRNTAAPLGYGPTTSDPKTGESIGAKAYLYGDSVRWVRNVAGDYYDLLTGKKTSQQFMNEGANGTSLVSGSAARGIQIKPIKAKLLGAQTKASLASINATSGHRSNYDATVRQLAANGNADIANLLTSEFGASLSKIGKLQAKVADKDLAPLHSHDDNHGCLFQADERIVAATKIVGILVNSNLTKEQILDRVESNVVFTTLLHEVGHNFGLRHNFQGSFDEMNFHPKYFDLQERLSKPGEVETVDDYLEMYKTSSIMDYNDMFEATNTDASPYDIAAIKYAYGDKMEVVDQEASQAAQKIITKDMSRAEYRQMVEDLQAKFPTQHRLSVENAIDQKVGVRPYMFCTDDHVENDPTCKRHDSGVTMAETIQNTVSDYDVGYILSGFRRNRRDFTGGSSSIIDRYIMPVRQLLDEYVYGIITGSMPETGPASREDYIEAINIGLDFFTKILNTPEPGQYALNPETGVYEPSEQPAEGAKTLFIGTNIAKYLKTESQTIGVETRVMRRGTELDKAAVLMALSMRGFPASKYEQLGLAANYFDLIKAPTLDIFSKAMRGKGEGSFVALETENGAVAITPEHLARLQRESVAASKPAPKSDVVKVKSSTSLFVETYAMIFAINDYDNTGDRSFRDYIDFRVVGDNDQSLPANTQKIAFNSASGLNRYVVPQTADGMSISYKIAQGADKKSEEAEALKAAIANPLLKDAAAQLIDLLFDKVLAGYANIFEKIQGEKLAEATITQLKANKADGMASMLSTIGNVVTQIAEVRAQGEATGNEELVKQMDEFLAAVTTEQKTFICDKEIVIGQENGANVTVPCEADSIAKMNADVAAKQDQVESIERELRTVEADLLNLQKMYKVINF